MPCASDPRQPRDPLPVLPAAQAAGRRRDHLLPGHSHPPDADGGAVRLSPRPGAGETGAEIVASACPFCMTMLEDGIKNENKEGAIKVFDLAELIAKNEGL